MAVSKGGPGGARTRTTEAGLSVAPFHPPKSISRPGALGSERAGDRPGPAAALTPQPLHSARTRRRRLLPGCPFNVPECPWRSGCCARRVPGDQGQGGAPPRPLPAEGPASRAAPPPPRPRPASPPALRFPQPGAGRPRPASASRSPRLCAAQGGRADAARSGPPAGCAAGAGGAPAGRRRCARCCAPSGPGTPPPPPSEARSKVSDAVGIPFPALGHCGAAGMSVAPLAQRWRLLAPAAPRPQTRAVRSAVGGTGLGSAVPGVEPSLCSLRDPRTWRRASLGLSFRICKMGATLHLMVGQPSLPPTGSSRVLGQVGLHLCGEERPGLPQADSCPWSASSHS